MAEVLTIKGKVKEINDLHELTQGYAKSAIENAIRIGELLTEIKGELEHGQWIPWVSRNLPFSRQEAANYMRAYARRGELNGKPVFHLKDAIEYLAEPKPKASEPEIEDEPEEAEFEEDPEPVRPQRVTVTPVVHEEEEEKEENPLSNAAIFDQWDKTLKELNAEIMQAIDKEPAAAWIYKPFYRQAMNKLRTLLKDAKPSGYCPDCKGTGVSCETCRGLGFISSIQKGKSNGNI
jgi:hypothetical protein